MHLHYPTLAAAALALASQLVSATIDADNPHPAPDQPPAMAPAGEPEPGEDLVAELSATLGQAADAVDRAYTFYAGRAHYQLRQSAPAEDAQTLLRAWDVARDLVVPGGPGLPTLFEPHPVLTERPVTGGLTSPFGVRRDPINRRQKRHNGVDFQAGRGAPVYASGPGVVTVAKRLGGYGRAIYIDHGLGLETRYAHLSAIEVEAGQFVPQGALIGKVGSSGRATGPHLHFEVRVDGYAVSPAHILSMPLQDGAAADDADDRPTTEDTPRRKARRKRTRRAPRALRRDRPNT